MCVRIINGIPICRKGQSNVEEALRNIIRTRHLPVQDVSSSSCYKDDFDNYTISFGETTAPCSIVSPDKFFSYATDEKDNIPVLITELY